MSTSVPICFEKLCPAMSRCGSNAPIIQRRGGPGERWVPSGQAARRGFTLTEMLIVASIIVLLATLALPAFNLLTGARSIEAGTNLVSAALARARAEAQSRQQVMGLAVYFDAERQRTALATVGFPTAWAPNTAYQRGDMIYVNVGRQREYWLCHTAHTSRTAGGGVTLEEMPSSTIAVSGAANAWARFDPDSTPPGGSLSVPAPDEATMTPDKYLSIQPESDVIYLPAGIGAEVLNSAKVFRASPGVPPVTTDRYTAFGVILFDADGRLYPTRTWGTLFNPIDAPLPMGSPTPTTTEPARFRSTRLGLAIRFNTDGVSPTRSFPGFSHNIDPQTTGITPNSAPMVSGLGIMLFDRQGYLSQSPPAWDTQILNEIYNTSAEQVSENWLDANGTLLLINRFSGTVLKAE